MIRASILGATGYGGVELVRLLLAHPDVEIVYVAGHSTVGQSYHEVYPQFAGVFELEVEAVDPGKASRAGDVVFSCLEHAVGTATVGELVDAGAKVIDFSADFRLKSVEVYEEHYKTHARPDLVGKAVYGLPELHREEIKSSSFVAVPGCYPTGATLALAPLAAKGLIDLMSCVADSKSGTSGAGRTNHSDASAAARMLAPAGYCSACGHRRCILDSPFCSGKAGRAWPVAGQAGSERET